MEDAERSPEGLVSEITSQQLKELLYPLSETQFVNFVIALADYKPSSQEEENADAKKWEQVVSQVLSPFNPFVVSLN